MEETNMPARSRLLTLAVLATAVSAPLARASYVTLFDDEMNRATFDAAHNGWTVQSYAKGQNNATFGRTPGQIVVAGSDDAFRYAVKDDTTGAITETNTITTAAFNAPVPGHYLDFIVSAHLNWSTAQTPGLVFGLSAYAQDANHFENAANVEFVTKTDNSPNTNAVSDDNVLLSTFNHYMSGTNNNTWSANVETGVNPTDTFHTYSIRVYPDKVDYLVDGNLYATTSQFIPTGLPLQFELNAFAPDSTWPSAYAPIPTNSYSYLDVSSVRVLDVTPNDATVVPEPASALLLLAAALPLSTQLRPRRNRNHTPQP